MKKIPLEVALVVATLLACVAFVGPRGDFPLNDDWNFALTTWHFAETGELVYSRFTAMTLKLQVLWGALWTIAFGKSHEVLRYSSLALWIPCVVIVNRWLSRIGVEAGTRLVATAAFAFHPLIFWSSFTYMTQIPFLFSSIVALCAFHRALDDDDLAWGMLGALAVVGAFFIRQTGVVLAIAPVVAILKRRSSLSPRWKTHVAVSISPVLLFALLSLFTNALRGYPGQIGEHFVVWKVPLTELPGQILRVVAYYTFFNFQNAGLFLLPVAILAGVWLARDRVGRTVALLAIVLMLAGAGHMVLRDCPMPYWSDVPTLEVHPGNVLVNLGLGPLTLRDTWTLDLEPPFPMPRAGRLFLTSVAAILGGLLMATLWRGWFSATNRPQREGLIVDIAVTHCVLATSTLFVSGIYFDRYTVDSLWTLAVLVPVLSGRVAFPERAVAVSGALLVAMFSALATQEYIRWNAARWEAYGRLRTDGISLARIDGGYEINQFLVGGFDGPILLKRSGFSVVDPEYILTFGRVPGYVVVAEERFESFLGLRHGAVLTLHRVDGERK
ncbi:MAG: glycosyltransferase family 39 protein [Acidobacteria bacterium]|nr:glycosyltransferase family 39 protein [Acidobacteriota bacterium]